MRSELFSRAILKRGAAAVTAALCCFVGALVLQGQQPASEAPKPQAEVATPATATTREYLGSEICQGCHEDIFTAFQKNPHKAVDTTAKHGRVGQACESCHGAASAHAESASAEDILNPGKLRAARTDQICLTCHLNQPGHAGRVQSGHAKGQVACTGCHAIHGSSQALVARKPAQVNSQCSGCHLSSWSQFQRPHSHRVSQGAMSCVDCHNPHGGFRQQQIRNFAANETGCLRCHTDKRGPFAFEHAPVRADGCTSCHEPHGSANPRMLTRHEVRFVCLECHANVGMATGNGNSAGQTLGSVPPSFHDLRSPRFQNCTICHQKIHGSHVDRSFLR